MSYRVLLVDDSPFIRTLLANILKRFGLKIVGEVENGKQAVDSYVLLRPDIVFMDIMMPVADGIEGLKGIRSIDPNAMVIMCTSVGQKDFVLEAFKEGAIDIIMKPFQEDRILKALGKIVKN